MKLTIIRQVANDETDLITCGFGEDEMTKLRPHIYMGHIPKAEIIHHCRVWRKGRPHDGLYVAPYRYPTGEGYIIAVHNSLRHTDPIELADIDELDEEDIYQIFIAFYE